APPGSRRRGTDDRTPADDNEGTMSFSLHRWAALPLALALAGCDGGSTQSAAAPTACRETGPYACKTGEPEPPYTFQWALNYAASFFQAYPETFGGGLDLNVEPVHRQGIKGRGVNVLVLDTGTDLKNEDLAPNADYSMSWNLVTLTADPYPVKADDPDE